MATAVEEWFDFEWRSSFVLKTVVLVAALSVLPWLVSGTLAGQILIFGILVMGYNLLLGYGGEMSFGHAAYFGTGAYGTIILFEQTGVSNLFVGILGGMAAAGVVSLVFGWVSTRRRNIYFAMITLALAQMLYTLASQLRNLTGGENGAYMPPVESALGPIDPTNGGVDFFAFALVLFFLVWLSINRVINSPFGNALVAVRESEQLARHLGYDSDRVLLTAFVISGVLAGLAGALHVVLLQFISPAQLFWTVSGEIVLMAIIGGTGTRLGPIVGAIVYLFFSDWLAGVTNNWPLFLGALFMIVVLLAPQGIVGIAKRYNLDRF